MPIIWTIKRIIVHKQQTVSVKNWLMYGCFGKFISLVNRNIKNDIEKQIQIQTVIYYYINKQSNGYNVLRQHFEQHNSNPSVWQQLQHCNDGNATTTTLQWCWCNNYNSTTLQDKTTVNITHKGCWFLCFLFVTKSFSSSIIFSMSFWSSELRGTMEMSRTARNCPQLLRCSFSSRK